MKGIIYVNQQHKDFANFALNFAFLAVKKNLTQRAQS